MSTSSDIANARQRLCELLRGASVDDADCHDESLQRRSNYEGLWSFLHTRILKHGCWQPQSEASVSAERELRAVYANHLRLRHTCGQILKAMHRADIAAICMRGLAVAERYYGELATLRPISDIDLMLDEARMLDAKQVLWDIGFRPNDKYRNLYQRGDMTVDLHHEPIGIERMASWQHITPLRAPDFFEHAESGTLAGTPAMLLKAEVELPYLCFHAMKHSFERLVWLYDIALLAHKVEERGEWEHVEQGILEYRLQRPCFYALSYVKEHLAAPVPDALLEAICPDMGWVERGLFRRHMAHQIIPYLAERLIARMQPDFRHRLAFWKETIYPRYEVREQMVTSGCVKCGFIRKRLKQLIKAGWYFIKEGFSLLKV